MGAFLFENYQCVFIHLPKAGGATIRNGIFKSEYTGPRFSTIPKEWDSLFTFTFVRNPYERIVSAWKMFTSGMESSNWSYNRNKDFKDISFYDFICIATDSSIDHTDRHDLKSILRHHTLPMSDNYHCAQYADYIGRFENYESDLKEILSYLSVDNYTITKHNVTSKGNYTKYYDQKCYNLVTKHYAKDLNLYNYKF